MLAVEAGKEVLWMKYFIGELGVRQEEYRLYCDSQSAIHLAKNAAYHSRTKHIQWKYHWIRERVEDREFALTKIHTAENGSDMLLGNMSLRMEPDRTRCKMQRTGSSQNRPRSVPTDWEDKDVNMPKSHMGINMT